jgi:oligopeptide transport system permease protein
MAIPSAIFSEAFLSFIGLGIQPPMTSLGQLSRTGSEMMKVYPYQLIIPSIVISLTMLSLNLLGDGLRDALDPRMRQ